MDNKTNQLLSQLLIQLKETEAKNEARHEAAEVRFEAAEARHEAAEAKLEAKLDEVQKEIKIISRNVIRIGKVVISDFDDISEETQDKLQVAGEKMVESASFQKCQETKNPKTKVARVQKSWVKTTQLLNKKIVTKCFGKDSDAGNLTKEETAKLAAELVKNGLIEKTISAGPLGRWLNSIMNKLAKITFRGGWPPITEDFVAILIDYYFDERQNIKKT
jgi:hypothetical protein